MDYSGLTPAEQRRRQRLMALPPEAQAVMQTAMAQAEAQDAEAQGRRAMWGQEFAAREKARERGLDLGNRRLDASAALQRRQADIQGAALSDQAGQDKEAATLGLLGLGTTGVIGSLGAIRRKEQADAIRKLADRFPIY